MKVRTLLLGIGLSVGASAYAAEPIKIGIPVGLSGANSVVAPSVVQASELAVEEINSQGESWGVSCGLKLLMTDQELKALSAPMTVSFFNGKLTAL
jgi:branched-chain amino acid transport system substrate-binding protein